ncbi:MAG: Mut7-C RNAse domain-containing protein [Thermodesulfobacteriota bacterium]|nr:Mut7-C RNAse domain-containing protein [Thermodesulfobacteriota bacterium]
MKFVADAMLGKLAKWLRVLGYDTCYQRCYPPGAIDQLVQEGRRLLSRQKEITFRYGNAILLRGHRVGRQMAELKDRVHLAPDWSKWFSRCLVCNALLEETPTEEARENVPEYIFFENINGIRFCPSCGRYYWPGSHRTSMVRQLEEWGFSQR